MSGLITSSISFERCKKDENKKLMYFFEKIASCEHKDGRIINILQSDNKNIITIEVGDTYNHFSLEDIVMAALSEQEET